MTNITFLYLNVANQLFPSFAWNIIQEEVTYSLGQVIMKPNIMQNYSYGYSHICFWISDFITIHSRPNVACISCIQQALILFIKAILLCYCYCS